MNLVTYNMSTKYIFNEQICGGGGKENLRDDMRKKL